MNYCDKAFQNLIFQKCMADQVYSRSCYFIYNTEGKGGTTGPKAFGWIN